MKWVESSPHFTEGKVRPQEHKAFVHSYCQWRVQLGLDFWLQIPVAPALGMEWDLQHLSLDFRAAWTTRQDGPQGRAR